MDVNFLIEELVKFDYHRGMLKKLTFGQLQSLYDARINPNTRIAFVKDDI